LDSALRFPSGAGGPFFFAIRPLGHGGSGLVQQFSLLHSFTDLLRCLSAILPLHSTFLLAAEKEEEGGLHAARLISFGELTVSRDRWMTGA